MSNACTAVAVLIVIQDILRPTVGNTTPGSSVAAGLRRLVLSSASPSGGVLGSVRRVDMATLKEDQGHGREKRGQVRVIGE